MKKDKLEGWTNIVVFVIIKEEYTMEVIGNYEGQSNKGSID